MDAETMLLIQSGLAALFVGLTKTGVPGLGILIVPLLAGAVGAKESAGYLLPMLLLGDVFAVARYRRHTDWRIVLRLLPWVLPGIALGLYLLDKLPTESLKPLFGALVISMVVLKAMMDRWGEQFMSHLPQSRVFSASTGILAGFTTAIGNIAGSVMAIYLISMGQKKHGFMGTSAWFFFIVNLIKLPFYYAYVGVITRESLIFNLKVTPLILLGVGAGFFVFRLIPQKWFNRVVIWLAAVAGLRLLISGIMH